MWSEAAVRLGTKVTLDPSLLLIVCQQCKADVYLSGMFICAVVLKMCHRGELNIEIPIILS